MGGIEITAGLLGLLGARARTCVCVCVHREGASLRAKKKRRRGGKLRKEWTRRTREGGNRRGIKGSKLSLMAPGRHASIAVDQTGRVSVAAYTYYGSIVYFGLFSAVGHIICNSTPSSSYMPSWLWEIASSAHLMLFDYIFRRLPI